MHLVGDWPERITVLGIQIIYIYTTSRFACLRCAACERYTFAGNRPSDVSKNYASRLADLSRPSGSSSTYKYLQFIGLKLKVQIVLVKIIGQNYPSRNIG